MIYRLPFSRGNAKSGFLSLPELYVNAVAYMDTHTYKNRMSQTQTYLHNVYAYVHIDF